MKLTELDFEKFDLEKYLDDQRIEIHSEGEKNVSSGWIGVSCPFCPDGDPSYHLGINARSKFITCWRCPAKGTISKYIMKIQNVSFKESIHIIKTYANTLALKDLTSPTESFDSPRYLKHDFKLINELQSPHKQYLESRNLNPSFLFKKYDLQCIGPGQGQWSNRIYIPVKQRNKTVAYTARAITEAKVPYKNAPDSSCIISVKDTLYNIDSVKNTIVVVEGPIDVWNTGDGFVCTFGTKFTDQQVSLLRQYKKIFILFDQDAEIPATSLLHQLNATSDTELLLLSEGDPGELKPKDIKSLRKMIFGRIY